MTPDPSQEKYQRIFGRLPSSIAVVAQNKMTPNRLSPSSVDYGAKAVVVKYEVFKLKVDDTDGSDLKS